MTHRPSPLAGPRAALSILLLALAAGCAQPMAAGPRAVEPAGDGFAGGVARVISDAIGESVDDEEGGWLSGEQNILFELNATPRETTGDEVFGFGAYVYPEDGFGVGFQVQSTLRGTDPELEVVLVPPQAELDPRTSEFVFDIVVTRRLSPSFGVFAGAGLATIERYRRFLDAVGNDFYVRTDRDYRLNGTVGAHFWLTDWLALSAQYDTIFEAGTFGIGVQF